jgi:hypothetical protein
MFIAWKKIESLDELSRSTAINPTQDSVGGLNFCGTVFEEEELTKSFW